MSEAAATIPRWAREFPPETWERMNELLIEGASAHEVATKCGIPEAKQRSLRAYAAQFGPRRRLRAFEKFKDAMAIGGAKSARKIAEAMERIAELMVSPETPAHLQVRAMEVMTKVGKQNFDLAAQDEERERARVAGAMAATAKMDPAAVVDEILKVYGVRK